MKKEQRSGAMAFLPLGVFLGLYAGCGLIFTFMGAEEPFSQFPRHVALLFGIISIVFLAPEIRFSDKLDVFCKGMGDLGVMQIVMIYLLAGGFQGAAASMGGKDSVINLCLHFIPVSLLVPGVFLICCLISTAIGTSMGTIAAMAPVAIGVAGGAGLDLALVGAAVIGGSYFGDDLSMISDTTISAAKGCGSEMKDKFRMNFFIALPAAVMAMLIYTILGGRPNGVIWAGGYDLLKVVPYITVLVAAVTGVQVFLVLFIGIGLTGVIGILQGSVSLLGWVQAIGNGISDMFSISIVAVLISGIIGIVRYLGGVEWLVGVISSRIHSRRGAEYGIGFLSGILSAVLVNNTIGIIVACPMAREIGQKYTIAPKRLASLVDIFACAFLAMMPHDGGMMIVAEMAGVSPIRIMSHSYYMFFLIVAACVTIHFGLMQTEEEREGREDRFLS